MAAPNQADALFLTGKLCANATDLASAYPHGGTALGLVGGVELVLGAGVRLLVEEETNAPYGAIPLGGPVELLVRLRAWDEDGVDLLLQGGSQTSSRPLLTFLHTVGAKATPLDNVVWSPTRSGYPFIVLRDVVAIPEVDNRMPATAYRNIEFRLRLIATNVSDSLGEMGIAGDVSL